MSNYRVRNIVFAQKQYFSFITVIDGKILHLFVPRFHFIVHRKWFVGTIIFYTGYTHETHHQVHKIVLRTFLSLNVSLVKYFHTTCRIKGTYLYYSVHNKDTQCTIYMCSVYNLYNFYMYKCLKRTMCVYIYTQSVFEMSEGTSPCVLNGVVQWQYLYNFFFPLNPGFYHFNSRTLSQIWK